MRAWLLALFEQQGINEPYLGYVVTLSSVLIIFVLSWLCYLFLRNYVLKAINKLATFIESDVHKHLEKHHFFVRIAQLIPVLLVLVVSEHLLSSESDAGRFIDVLAKIIIAIQVARCISTLLNVVNSVYDSRAREKFLPINSATQLIKLVVYLVAVILSIGFALDKSPVYLLSGLGALTAVLMLIFQDTLKGLVASIQISANRMVAPGDWIQMPQYGADGDVMEIGLNTVKVRNFDRTITTIPTYALTTESFKNWREMYFSGGRRVKRALQIDMQSIRFLSEQDIERWQQIDLLKNYLADKSQSLAQSNLDVSAANARKLTNIGTFRAYLEVYLQQHPEVNQQMTHMVRQLAPDQHGLPVELYFFLRKQEWVMYESIQADIIDHVVAMAGVFELRIYQRTTGHLQ